MDNSRRWTIAKNLIFLLIVIAATLFILGGIVYHRDHYAKTTHELNSCEVITSSYYQTRCSGSRRSYVCYVPVWLVTYSIFPDRITATIEPHGFRTTAAAENELDQYQVCEVSGQPY